MVSALRSRTAGRRLRRTCLMATGLHAMAPLDGFAVRPDALAMGAGAVGSAAQELQQLIGSLVGVGRQLADAVGEPAAAGAALEFTARWGVQLRRLEALVDGLGMAVALAGERYVRSDADVAGALEGGPGP